MWCKIYNSKLFNNWQIMNVGRGLDIDIIDKYYNEILSGKEKIDIIWAIKNSVHMNNFNNRKYSANDNIFIKISDENIIWT